MCDQLKQLNDFTLRQNPLVNLGQVIQIACGACQRKEVCPELGMDAYLNLSRKRTRRDTETPSLSFTDET